MCSLVEHHLLACLHFLLESREGTLQFGQRLIDLLSEGEANKFNCFLSDHLILSEDSRCFFFRFTLTLPETNLHSQLPTSTLTTKIDLTRMQYPLTNILVQCAPLHTQGAHCIKNQLIEL